MTTGQEVSPAAVESLEAVEKKSVFHSETPVEVEENREESPIKESKEEAAEEAVPKANGPSTETATEVVETEQPPKDVANQEEDPSGDVELKGTEEEEEEVDGPELVDSSPEEEDSEAVEHVEDEATREDEDTAAAATTENEEKPISAAEEETTEGSGAKTRAFRRS